MTTHAPPRAVRAVLVALTSLALAAYALVVPAGIAHAASTLLSQGQPVTASSAESAAFPAADAVDGNLGTRWASGWSDPQWIQVDPGQTTTIRHIQLVWEAAYGQAYQIQTSNDGTNSTTIYSTTTGIGGVDDFDVSGSGRYVRRYGTVRGTAYGYSLYEFGIYS